MSRQWYSFYVGDYTQKTAHLSLLEHGAYRLLIDHYMATGNPLPNDHTKLYRICRARSPSERKAVLSVASEFFIDSGTLLRHKKCDSELNKLLNYSDAQRAKAMLRHSHGNATAMPARADTTTTKEKERKKEDVYDVRAGEETPFEKVFSFGTNIFPQLSKQNASIIHSWISSGADVELDIIPEIQRLHDNGAKPRGWGLFTQDIATAFERRLKPMPKGEYDEKPRRNSASGSRKSTWKSEGERLTAKYLEDAEREEQSAIISDSEPNLRLTEAIRED